MADHDSEAPLHDDPSSRRQFLALAAGVSMTGGLLAGYGALAVMAGRFLFPTARGTAWLFVTDVVSLPPGQSMPFESPTGVKVTIKRSDNDAAPANVADFVALSSICPHLGCRVHWESHNNRFFCPCHNGVFDPQGQPTAGPPLAAGQQLPRYPLQIDHGLLFIEMPLDAVGARPDDFIETTAAEPHAPHGQQPSPRSKDV